MEFQEDVILLWRSRRLTNVGAAHLQLREVMHLVASQISSSRSSIGSKSKIPDNASPHGPELR